VTAAAVDREVQSILDRAAQRKAAGLLTVADAADSCGVGVVILRGLIASGELPTDRDGLVQRDDVLALLGRSG